MEAIGRCDEDTLAEFVDGEVVMYSPASITHQRINEFLVPQLLPGQQTSEPCTLYKNNEVVLMKIGVISDTHDNVTKIMQAVEFFNEQDELEVVVHAGDFVSPFAVAAMSGLQCRLVAVFGNNEGEKIGVAKRFEGLGDLYVNFASVEVNNRKIAVAHYPELADALAKGGQFDIVVYGHTHEIDTRKEGETLVINPGECGGWLTGKSTIATVDLETLEPEVHELK